MNKLPTIQKIILSERQVDYNPADEIRIKIPANEVPFLIGKDSYLRFSVKLSGLGNNPAKATLDRNGGGYAVLDTVRIYAGTESGLLIETIEDYSCLIAVRNKYENTSGLENRRQLLEGLPPKDAYRSQYFKNFLVGDDIRWEYEWVEVCLPLWGTCLHMDSVLPVMASDGIEIVITLADAKKAIKTIGNFQDNVDGFMNSREKNGNTQADVGAGNQQDTARNIKVTDDTIAAGNTCWTAAPAVPPGTTFPQRDAPYAFEIQADLGAGPQAGFRVCGLSTATGQPAAFGGAITAAALPPNVRAPEAVDFPWTIGAYGNVIDDTGAIVRFGPITDIARNANNFIQITAAINSGGITAADHRPCWVSYVPDEGATVGLTYTIRDVQFIASVFQPEMQYVNALIKKMKSPEGFKMDIKTQNLYKNNLLAGQTNVQELIPTNEKRAKSLLELFINPALHYTTSFYAGISDNFNQYQYNIRNRLIPQLPVLATKEYSTGLDSWNSQLDAERVKALQAFGIDVHEETAPAKDTFCWGRQVALPGHSSNMSIGDTRCDLQFGVTQGATNNFVLPQLNKLMYTYVKCFKTLFLKPNQSVLVQ